MNPQSDMKRGEPTVTWPGSIISFEMSTFSWNNKWSCYLRGCMGNSIIRLSAMYLVNLNCVLQLLKHARSYNLPVLKSVNFKSKKQRQGLKTTIQHKASFILMKNDVRVLPIDKNANCRFP